MLIPHPELEGETIETDCPELPPNCPWFEIHRSGVDFVDPNKGLLRGNRFDWPIYPEMSKSIRIIVSLFAANEWEAIPEDLAYASMCGPTTQHQEAAELEIERRLRVAGEWRKWGRA